jgi:hypothetical protein
VAVYTDASCVRIPHAPSLLKQVILAVAADQPFWAYRIGQAGVGPQACHNAHNVTAA